MYREDDYKTLKEGLSNFVKQKASSCNHLGDQDQLTQLIRRDKEAATYERLQVTADCQNRTAVLHREVFPPEHQGFYISDS
jgi:hypothetical protein